MKFWIVVLIEVCYGFRSEPVPTGPNGMFAAAFQQDTKLPEALAGPGPSFEQETNFDYFRSKSNFRLQNIRKKVKNHDGHMHEADNSNLYEGQGSIYYDQSEFSI